MPAGTRWSTPRSGHLVWVALPAGADADRLQQAARARGVAYARGELFHADGGGADHLALSFAALDAGAIAAGVARLAAVVRAAEGTRRARRRPHRPPARARTPRRAGTEGDARR